MATIVKDVVCGASISGYFGIVVCEDDSELVIYGGVYAGII